MAQEQRAATLMVASMAFFAFEDMLIKLLTLTLPGGQIMLVAGMLGAGTFWAMMAARGQKLWTRTLLNPLILTRNLGEAICAVLFVTALRLGDLSTASAILQALPLVMTLGAVVFLREPVGWRRWLSIALGFIGVLMIVRPGTEAFQPASLLAVGAVLALALRDLVTRRIPPLVPSEALTATAFAAMAVGGLALLLIQGQAPVLPSVGQGLGLLGVTAFGLAGYSLMVVATRLVPIAAIAPFRYSRLVFALVLGVVVFDERPDAMMLLGSAVIVGSGIYAMLRERVARR